jgi:ribosomal protein S12 methylthiotransferase accessory factor
MLRLASCSKGHTSDLDKAVPPGETVRRATSILESRGPGILARTERIDTGRLGIPVYLSQCGPKAQEVLPGRKQMGKGASPEQAEASALMELIERYSLFSFWQSESGFHVSTWSEAERRFPGALLPLERILQSVGEELDPGLAKQALDLLPWRFAPALEISGEQSLHLPVDWFRKLNEFNGSAAGNTFEEAALQGGCELVERHVCALIDRDRPVLPTLDPESFHDPVLKELFERYTARGIHIWLKDFSLGLGVPTVGALAYDPSTWPMLSEIVFTAGTATSPAKAAIRALTEVAQLAGDFHTGSCYDPSGLSKPRDLEACRWLQAGPKASLDSLPDGSHPDLLQEIKALAATLQGSGYAWYAKDITHPDLGIPAIYNIVPGFQFRERAAEASLGMFLGRMLAEERPLNEAKAGLDFLARLYPGGHFLDFFRGMLQLRQDRPQAALELFASSEGYQPTPESKALAAFYQAFALSRMEAWQQSLEPLQRAQELSPDSYAFCNLRGVAHFKLGQYAEAAREFSRALEIDGGAALDMANLGLCYLKMGKNGAAKDFFQRSLEIDPDIAFAKAYLEELTAST